MSLRTIWPADPIFIEIGVQDADLGLSLRHAGYSKYLGVSGSKERIAQLHAAHPELARNFTYSTRRKLVLHNNAEVLILSGQRMFYLWKFRTVRHAHSVGWRLSFNPLCLLALFGCLFHAVHKRCSWPRLVSFAVPGGKTRRMFVSKILKYRLCHRDSLHFIPHQLGLPGFFRQLDKEKVRYVVLRWFEALPEIEPTQDVDMLVDDQCLRSVFDILHALPGIQPCDVYSESGMARSGFSGLPYYPSDVAHNILNGAVRHKNVCMVPSPSDYFHSLAYHAVYHKGLSSGLPCAGTGLTPEENPGHDYTGILRQMAEELRIDVEIDMESLHSYLTEHNWAPTPDLLGRLASASPENPWLQKLAKELAPEIHDQGLAVFILRQEAVRRGFQDKMIAMIEKSGFEILAVKPLLPDEVAFAMVRVRGGDWTSGDFSLPGGPPAVTVVAYDRAPISPSRKQLRKYPQRYNARVYVKEAIRDAIAADSPPNEVCNGLHSSDHAAEAWHLIEALAPELVEEIRSQIRQIQHTGAPTKPALVQQSPELKTSTPLRRAA